MDLLSISIIGVEFVFFLLKIIKVFMFAGGMDSVKVRFMGRFL